jgi:hypothetical protein
MNNDKNRQNRYQRWANLIEFNPEIIDRLPPTKQSYLIARVKELQAETLLADRATEIEHQQQSQLLEQNQINTARFEYIQERAIAITPEALPKLSEHFASILIIVASAFVFGNGVANLTRESGREDLAPIAGVLGGCVIGCLAEYSGKKLFVDRAMSKQYYAERNRLLAQKQEIAKRIIPTQN